MPEYENWGKRDILQVRATDRVFTRTQRYRTFYENLIFYQRSRTYVRVYIYIGGIRGNILLTFLYRIGSGTFWKNYRRS